jgi:drug/metabolite transporter (DMT)-like permease
MIRRHLSAAPLGEKIALGRQLFDVAVQRQLRVRLDEIDTTLLERLAEEHLRLDEVDGMFEAIAEGKLDAEDATIALFVHDGKQRRHGGSGSKWVLRASGAKDLEDRVLRAARTYGLEHVSIDERGRMVHVRAIMNLTDERVRSLESMLASFMPIGTWSLRRTAATRALIAAVAVLLALWGLDPVLAHILLQRGMSPYDLTFVRAVTFFATSSLLYGAQIATSRRTLKWLSPTHPTLILSGSALFVTALFSYLALSGIAATTYILCIIMGLLVPVLMRQAFDRVRWRHTGVALVIVTCGAGISASLLGFNDGALLAGVGSGFAFALYSELTRRYQHEGAIIRARYPAFLFWMSCVGMVLALFLLPFVHIATVSAPMLMTSTLFALAFSVLPYGLYFEISRRMNTSLLDRSLPLVAIITVLGEFILTASFVPLVVIPVIIGFLLYFYGFTIKKRAVTP